MIVRHDPARRRRPNGSPQADVAAPDRAQRESGAGEPVSDASHFGASPVPDKLSAASGTAFPRTPQDALLHDLRTPLNQIIGYSEMLSEQALDDGQNGLMSDLDKIRAAGGQLLALINSNSRPGAALGPDEAPGAEALGIGCPEVPPSVSRTGDTWATEGQLASRAARGFLLVVDDNEMNRDVLSRSLKRQGHDVVTVTGGREALAAVRAQPFDLVLLDIMMPEMDGYEVLRTLKADQAYCHIPVIMISALHEVASVVRCIEMGADDYLYKPFEPPLLKARIGACLEKKRAEDRAAQLHEQLQQNFKRLQELEKLRDDLTNMIVHDLRTPLASVIAGLYSLETIGDLNESQREMMGIALSGGETLLGMINDLLDVEKLESGSMELDYALLSAAVVVAAAVGQISSLAESQQVTLIQQVMPNLPALSADEKKLLRTLVNLLGNAIKFTPSGGTVTIDAHVSADGQSMQFAVSDTGQGIPPEAFGRIFEKFGQVAPRQGGRTMGTGLGLTFCKLAVEAHGGRIWVESACGQGSTFRFTIPLQTLETDCMINGINPVNPV